MLRISSLDLELGKRKLFSDINLEIARGSCMWLRGSNGVGKTTLLRLIAGLIMPSEGDVFYENDPVIDNARYRQVLVYLASPFRLRGSLRVREFLDYLEIIFNYRGYDEEELRTLSLYDLLDKKINTLSSGQRQRIGLLPLLQTDRDIFLLDEPYNHLDQEATSWLDSQLLNLMDRKKTILVVSHRSVPHFKKVDLQ